MIAVVQGGHESEAEVSRMTSKAFQTSLEKMNMDYIVLEFDKSFEKKLKEAKPEVCLLALHGTGGEDGVVQDLLEKLKIPYTGSGVSSSNLSFDKIKSLDFASSLGVQTLPSVSLLKNEALDTEAREMVENWEDGYVVKPSRSGSSRGVSLCEDLSELEAALQNAYKWCDEVIIEKKLLGIELAVSVLKNKAFEPIEIRPKTGFYDMKNKYTKGATEYLLPAEISKELKEELKKSALKIFQEFQISTYCRVDFLAKKNSNESYFMEVNTLPGCTETSLFPKALEFEGVKFDELIQVLIKDASLKS